MRRSIVTALAMTAVFAAWSIAGMAVASEALPSKSDESCLKCHKFDKDANTLAGRIADVSMKAKTIQLQIGKEMDVIYFDDATALKNAPAMNEIPKTEAVKIVYYKRDGKNFAKEIEVKKGLKVAEDKLASVEEVAKLVALGPQKGKYLLIDSRPLEAYNAGHILTAVSLPFPAFDKMAETVLPKDKETLQIYYCIGFT